MNILGVSCPPHAPAAALLRQGRCIAAADEHLLSPTPRDRTVPVAAIADCLERGEIDAQDLDLVVLDRKPFLEFDRVLRSAVGSFPRTGGLFRESMIEWLSERLWTRSALIDRLGLDPRKLIAVEHHTALAAHAFFGSPFGDAAVLTLASAGERATTTCGVGAGTRIDLVREIPWPHSLGLLEAAFLWWLGDDSCSDGSAITALAARGEPRLAERVRRLVVLGEDGSFRLNLGYFRFHTSAREIVDRRFLDLFGPRRAAVNGTVEALDADVAASVRQVTGEVLHRMVSSIHGSTGKSRLCVAAGSSVDAGPIAGLPAQTPFIEVVPAGRPVASGAIGAALYAWHHLLGMPRPETYAPALG